jgi:Tat protein secretion system quality control protein TatD with DNase activity
MVIQRERLIMTSAVYVEQARDWSTRLEELQAQKSGTNLSEARKVVAREIGASPSTLENLRNRRVKGIAAHIYDRLKARVVRELEEEVRHLTHELHVLNATGVHPASSEVAEAEADLARVRKVLGLDNGGGA